MERTFLKWKSLMPTLEEGQRIVLLTIAGEKCSVQSEKFSAFSNIKMSYLVVAFLKYSYSMNTSFISKFRKRKTGKMHCSSCNELNKKHDRIGSAFSMSHSKDNCSLQTPLRC